MQLDAIIFDMDGTMFDTEKVWARAWPPTCESFGLPFSVALDDACRGTSGETFAHTIEKYYAVNGYPGVDGHAFMEALWAAANAEFDKGIEKMRGLDEILAWVDGQGLPRAVASGSDMGQIKHHLGMFGLLDYFDALLSGFEVARSKPEPDIFLEAAERLGARPERTVVIEDSCNGIRAAYAGGFIPIMVPDYESPDDVEGLYYRVCNDLIEVRDLLAGLVRE